MEATAEQIAQWMLEEVQFNGTLRQEQAIEHIKSTYGEAFVYVNENGNASIAKEVKKAFKKLHGGKVGWDRDGFFWYWT